MIPKLCTDITDTNGLGRLADVISVSVKQELNGAYELTMTYPITGALYEQIEVDRLIGTRSGEGSGVQYFRIVRISRPINGIVSIYAQHYSYQLNYIHVPPCVVTGTVQSCLDQLKALCIEGCDFTLTSELANVMTVVVEKPTALRSVIGGMDGSILEQLHAEALWDNDTVVIKSALVPTVIGQRNVALRYGKNMADLEAEDSIEAFYSGVLPYWQKEVDGTDVYVQGAIQYSQAQGAFDYERIYPLDLSSDFDDQPSVADLNAAGASFVTANNVGTITPSITATPAQIWETKEYAALAGIESLRLGSMTDIIYNRLGVNATAEVVETVWDGLLERYSSMTFGAPRANVVDDIVNIAAPTIQKAGGGGGGGSVTVDDALSTTSPNPVQNAVITAALNEKMEHWDLLWENPSITSVFAGQTLSPSFAGYDFFLLIYGLSNTSPNNRMSMFLKVGEQSSMSFASWYGSSTLAVNDRSFYFTNNKIHFNDCTRHVSGQSSSSTYNNGAIPQKIYGIKNT